MIHRLVKVLDSEKTCFLHTKNVQSILLENSILKKINTGRKGERETNQPKYPQQEGEKL